MNIVRDNLLTSLGYTPYCGGATCGWHWPRTTFKGLQFHCKCGWVSAFEPEFIEQYKAAQAKLKAGLDAQPVTCPPNGMTVTHAPHFIEQTAEHTDGVTASGEASAWWALVMGAAASIEDAANCLRDPDAKKQADGAAKHYREAAQKLMAASGVTPTGEPHDDAVLSLADHHAEESQEDGRRVFERGGLIAFARELSTLGVTGTDEGQPSPERGRFLAWCKSKGLVARFNHWEAWQAALSFKPDREPTAPEAVAWLRGDAHGVMGTLGSSDA